MPRARPPRPSADHTSARLAARPAGRPSPPTRLPSGAHPLGVASGRDGVLYVPAGYAPERPAPLLVLVHGAGADARDILPVLRDAADAMGVLIVAPDARGATWDMLLGRYGPDVAHLDAALTGTFARCAVDATRVAAAGFSDGASYALSLGLANGALFTHVIAFSPGFMAPPAQVGVPRIFISHGTRDRVLPIDPCSRRLVPQLERGGYDVRYVEFDGGHAVPPAVRTEAMMWFTEDR